MEFRILAPRFLYGLLDHTELLHDLASISIMISALHLSSLPFDLMSMNHITSEKIARVSN